jgi:hypothetical protein
VVALVVGKDAVVTVINLEVKAGHGRSLVMHSQQPVRSLVSSQCRERSRVRFMP